MSQLSSQFVKPAVKNKLDTLLIDCVTRCQDNQTTIDFLDDLLTPTEKVMLSKRIAIALMLLKKKTYQEIMDVLKVTNGTICRVKIWLGLKGSGFKKLLESVIKEDERKKTEKEELLRSAEEDNPIWAGPINWRGHKRRQWQKAEEAPGEVF